MTTKILLVDDEENILLAYTRVLRRRFVFETALGGGDALQILQEHGPFAVVVSDMRMPGMDGVELLSRVKERYPDTIRMMLTGNAEQSTAQDAVNRGAIFRFLNKPCDPETLASALQEGLAQYRLVTAEKVLLEQTLKGSITMMVELMSLLDPCSFGRAQAIANLAERIAAHLKLQDAWVIGVAAVLSQVGVLTVPGSIVGKLRQGAFLSTNEREIANSIPGIGSSLIRNIPRLESVADSIQYMNKNFNGTGYPHDDRRGGEIPIGGRILRVVNDYLSLSEKGGPVGRLLEDMAGRTAWYDLLVVEALREVLYDRETQDQAAVPVELPLGRLTPGHVLAENVTTEEGILVLPAGTHLGMSHLEKIRNFHRIGEVGETFSVYGA